MADLALDKQILVEIVRKKSLWPAHKCELVDCVRGAYGASLCRACRLVQISPGPARLHQNGNYRDRHNEFDQCDHRSR